MTHSIVSKDQLHSILPTQLSESDESFLGVSLLDDKQVSLGDDLIKILQIRALVKQLEDQTVKNEFSVVLDKHSLRMAQEDFLG